MDKAEAQAEAAERNADSRQPGFWAAQEAAGEGWRVVHVAAPGLRQSVATGSHAESRPKPEEPPDPRPPIFQNIPPYGAG